MPRLASVAGFGLIDLLGWWAGGLLCCLPRALRRAFQYQRTLLVIEPEGDSLRLRRETGGAVEEVGVIGQGAETGSPAGGSNGRAVGLVRRNEVPVLRVPRRLALVKDIGLPLAAEENLREVVGFEMDRHTPFAAVDTFYDFELLRRDRDTQRLAVRLIAVPRPRLQVWLDRLAALGLAPAVVDVAGERAAVNLLPPERRPPRRRGLQRLNLLLGLVAIALVGASALIPLWHERAQVIAMISEVAVAQKRAEAVAVIRGRFEQALEASEFVLRKKAELPVASDVLLELTKILPNGTWLSQFSMKTGQIDLRGESTEASALIGLLQASALFDAAEFRSPITTNRATGRDRFYIVAQIAGQEPPP